MNTAHILSFHNCALFMFIPKNLFSLFIVLLKQNVYNNMSRYERSSSMEILLLGGGLLIIIFAVVVAAVTSVISGIAGSELDED